MDVTETQGTSGAETDPGDSFNSMWQELRGVPFSQGWLKAGDIATRYIHTGSDDKPGLIFLHGFIGHAEAFIRNLASHGEHFNCYAIDMMGTGYSDKPNFPYHAPVVAQQVADFMDAAGIETASVLGTSYGSRIASRFAINHMDRLDKLTLVSPSGLHFDPVRGARILDNHDAIATPTWSASKQVVANLWGEDALFDDMIACRQAIFKQPEMAEVEKHLAVPHQPETAEQSLTSAEEFATLKSPALVVAGVEDKTHDPKAARELCEAIPNGRLVIMEGCNHGPYFEKPEEFNKIHLNFLLDR